MARGAKHSQDQEPAEARPFLKWAGGKRQLIPELLRHVPETFGTYHEPFVGGGALFFALRAAGRIGKARLSDVNPELMNVWTQLQLAPENVIGELERLEQRLTEDDFYEVRGRDPATLTPPERAARVIYLNKTGFNGLYRENSKGRFNVPWGRNSSSTAVLDRANLLAVSRALRGVELLQSPFSTVLKHARPGDFVYFDPPYHPVSGTASFTAYSRGGFGEEGQQQLATAFSELAANGVHVMLSNSDTPFIQELFAGRGEVHRVEARRAINSKADRRGAVGELIICARGAASPKRAAKAAAARQLAIEV